MAHEYKFIALIPPFSLSTRESRAVLPDQVLRQDAVFNISHVALLLGALVNGDDVALKSALQDRLHQPYRGKLIPHYDEIITKLDAEPNVLGAYLSGAGPTIMVLTKLNGSDNFKENVTDNILCNVLNGWKIIPLEISWTGYEIIQ